MELILIFLIVLIVVAASCIAACYALLEMQRKENAANQPSPTVIRTANNRKVNLNTKVLLQFLEQADNAYIEAFQRSNIEYFLPYCTIPLAMNLNNMIIYCNNKVFGLSHHRTRTWTILEVREASILVRKNIDFNRIKEGGEKSYITYADPIEEVWKVGFNPTRFQVLEVKESA